MWCVRTGLYNMKLYLGADQLTLEKERMDNVDGQMGDFVGQSFVFLSYYSDRR